MTNQPKCIVCGGIGNGVQFQIFGSKLPFGQCCVKCESDHTKQELELLSKHAKEDLER